MFNEPCSRVLTGRHVDEGARAAPASLYGARIVLPGHSLPPGGAAVRWQPLPCRMSGEAEKFSLECVAG